MKRIVALIACLAIGCGLLASEVVPVTVGIADSLCQLASDQGAAEPGWEVWTCSLVDVDGKPTGANYEVHLPNGSKVQAIKKGWTTATVTPGFDASVR